MRKLIYLIIVVSFIALVFFKIKVIEKKENKEIISITEEWRVNGKPVDVVNVKRGNIYYLEKVSEILRPGGIIEGDVPEYVVAKLDQGQEFTAEINGKLIEGHLKDINRQRDLVTGLYKISLKITSKNNLKAGLIIVAKVRVRILKDVLKIPPTAVMTVNSNSYCWVVKNNKVEKRKIKLGIGYEDEVRVISGLSLKETVCVNGLDKLSENDTVRIRKTENK